jgi:hypothetical protein
MTNTKINKTWSDIRKKFDFLAKEELKSNSKLKLLLKDCKSHFSQKNPWALDLEIVKSYSCISNPYIFNSVLELKGYKIFYNKKTRSVVFKK